MVEKVSVVVKELAKLLMLAITTVASLSDVLKLPQE